MRHTIQEWRDRALAAERRLAKVEKVMRKTFRSLQKLAKKSGVRDVR